MEKAGNERGSTAQNAGDEGQANQVKLIPFAFAFAAKSGGLPRGVDVMLCHTVDEYFIEADKGALMKKVLRRVNTENRGEYSQPFPTPIYLVTRQSWPDEPIEDKSWGHRYFKALPLRPAGRLPLDRRTGRSTTGSSIGTIRWDPGDT